MVSADYRPIPTGNGFLIAQHAPVWMSVAVFVVVGVAVALFIRDNLTLNIIMLIRPVDAIRRWQMGG
jgi:hypothetical protein